MSNEYLLVSEVAEKIGVSQKTVRDYIQGGQLKAYKLGKQWKITPADLNAFIESKSNIHTEKGED